jgi:hypothetical protein
VSTGLIVLIAVVAAIVLVTLLLLPRMREAARIKARERELHKRREQAADEHRAVAETRAREAEEAEQRARIARQEAELHQQHATAHQRGLADDQLIDDEERERFAGTSAVPRDELGGDRSRDGDGDGGDGDADRTTAYSEGRMAANEPRREQDFEQGRADEQNRGGLFGRFRRGNKDREPASRR